MVSHEQTQIALTFLAMALWCVLIVYKDKFVVLTRIGFALITIAALVGVVGVLIECIGLDGTIGILFFSLVLWCMSAVLRKR